MNETGLEPVCHVCKPESCDIFEKCKGKRTVEEGTVAVAIAAELSVLQVRVEACRNIQKRAFLQERLAGLARTLSLEDEKTVWHIGYEGLPANPRFRRRKRRTASIVTDKSGAKRYADQLERGLHVKVLSIKQKEA